MTKAKVKVKKATEKPSMPIVNEEPQVIEKQPIFYDGSFISHVLVGGVETPDRIECMMIDGSTRKVPKSILYNIEE